MSQAQPPAPRPPEKPDETKTWLQAIGLTFGLTFAVIGGMLAIIVVALLAFVGLVLWTCSSH
ncbi:MAG: hypothetical protein H6719_09745 [Sandaracinaceae bacterium]|nr:hypothetical protein [Sandaracinaceae bacterium]